MRWFTIGATAFVLFSWLCCADEAALAELPPDVAVLVQRVESLGGAAEVVDGRVVGVSFQIIEKLVFDAPNEVFLPTVTNETLVVITKFPGLKRLSLQDANISDAGMVHVGALTELEELSLRRTKVTQKGLRRLERCKRLRILDLLGMELSAEGLKALTYNMQLSRTLHELYLSGSSTDDEGAEVLSSFSSLQTLRLSNTNIGDGAVKHLAKLKNLRLLHVNSTQVTARGAAALRRALPKARIITEDAPP